ncbi:ATP-binding protein [Aliivibrio salmonicida]|uniref:PAS domain-containing hybrid sensor histidine kinase/response regulator n=1 Tax=Aliivibrio salmonicida TaxID=40269 RepID=UPI003D13DE7F
MFRFDKKNGKHLFSIFILLGTCVFAIISSVFVQHQAQSTAKLMVEESQAGRFAAIQNFTKEFLYSHEQTLNKMVEHPLVRASTLQGIVDKEAFKDELRNLKSSSSDGFFYLYDFSGNEIYGESLLPQRVQDYLRTGIVNESLFKQPSYSFFEDNGLRYLMVSLPVFYNQLAEGLGVYITSIDEKRFNLGISDDGNYWAGIEQNRLGWLMPAPKDWEVKISEIPGTLLAVSFALSPSLFADAEKSLFQSLFIGLSTATAISFCALFFLGQRFFVSPYQKLYNSEQELSIYADKLKRREEESALLARVAKHMRDAVVFTDADIKATWVNQAFEKLSGFDAEEVMGKNPGELLQGANTNKETIHAMRVAIDNQESGFFEIVNYNKKGEAYWVELALTPLYSQLGELESFMAVARDITQRVNLENSLRQKAIEAEAANIAKSRFLASMSHELRTPMNGVFGMGEILKMTELSKEQEEYIDVLLGSGEHMLSVLNDILEFSKIESGRLDIKEKSFSLLDVMGKIIHMYSPLCLEKGLIFTHNLKDQKNNRLVLSDEQRILQILQNLVGNAFKFTSEGRITLEVNISGECNNAYITLEVGDSGIGIEKDKLETIFEPFVQVENDNTRSFGGTGLGLAITFDIVKAMGGDIRVKSELGEGSRFFVQLPIKYIDTKPQLNVNKVMLFNGKGESVLIVEDNKVNAKILEKILMLRGFECELATNGEIAIEKVKAKSFNCIFMDNHMPIMDGNEATSAIKALKLVREPVIIGYTADAFEDTRQKMMDNGCVDVITKPINVRKLDKVLHRWL